MIPLDVDVIGLLLVHPGTWSILLLVVAFSFVFNCFCAVKEVCFT
jgi:hypothetical protein